MSWANSIISVVVFLGDDLYDITRKTWASKDAEMTQKGLFQEEHHNTTLTDDEELLLHKRSKIRRQGESSHPDREDNKYSKAKT